MTKKQSTWSFSPGARVLTRRDVLAYGAVVTASSIYLPGGLICSAGAQTVSSSFDYYIGPKGSDSNPGTLASPWALTAINTKQATYAGKKVGLLNGTYDLVAIMGQPTSAFDTGSLAIAGGSAGSPTVVGAVNPRQAIIDWDRAAVTNGSAGSSMQPKGDYVTIDGLVFTRNNYRSVVNYTNGGSNFTIKNCLFQDQSYTVGSTGANSCMIYTQGHDHILISNCRFTGGSAPVDSGRHAVIQAYSTTTDIVIEFCTFVGQDSPPTGHGIHFKAANINNPVVRNCFIDRSLVTVVPPIGNGACIMWEGSLLTTDQAVIHNCVMRAGQHAQCLWCDTSGAGGGTAGTWQIYDNTFIGPWNNTGCLSHMWRSSPVQTNIYNNIWYRTVTGGTYGDVNVYSIGSLGTMDRNMFAGGPAPTFTVGSGATTYTGLTSWLAASGKDLLSVLVNDPQFVASGAEAAYYQLQASSLGKTLGVGGIEIGAWSGASQVGCSFGVGGVVPSAPQLSVS